MRDSEILKRCGIYLPQPPGGWYMDEEDELAELIRSLGGGKTRRNYNHMIVDLPVWEIFPRELERERTRVRPACVVLAWGWVAACAEAGRYLGHEEDWGGHLIHAPDVDFPKFRPWIPSGQFKRRREDESSALQDDQGNVIEVKRRRASPPLGIMASSADLVAEYIPSLPTGAAPLYVQPNANQLSFLLRSTADPAVPATASHRTGRPLAWIPCSPPKTVLALDETDDRPVAMFEKIPDGMDTDDDGLTPLSSASASEECQVLLDIAPVDFSQTTSRVTSAPAPFTLTPKWNLPGRYRAAPPPPFVLTHTSMDAGRPPAPSAHVTDSSSISFTAADIGVAQRDLSASGGSAQFRPRADSHPTGQSLTQLPSSIPIGGPIAPLLPLFTSVGPHCPPA